jgi:hypothetical protein
MLFLVASSLVSSMARLTNSALGLSTRFGAIVQSIQSGSKRRQLSSSSVPFSIALALVTPSRNRSYRRIARSRFCLSVLGGGRGGRPP